MTDFPEPWQLYPMPAEQVAKIQAHIDRMASRKAVTDVIAVLQDDARWRAWYRDNVERLDEIDVDMSFAEAAAHYLRDELLGEDAQ